MKSTGEVMGIDTDFSNAYAKASIAAGLALPKSGKIFITMIDKFKDEIVPVAKQLKVRPADFSSCLFCHVEPITSKGGCARLHFSIATNLSKTFRIQ